MTVLHPSTADHINTDVEERWRGEVERRGGEERWRGGEVERRIVGGEETTKVRVYQGRR